MRVEEIMTSPVLIVRLGTPLQQVRKLFKQEGFSALPVLDRNDDIVGIVTSSDMNKAPNNDINLNHLMTDKVHVLVKTNRVVDAANLMLKHKIHHLVVMDDGKIVGMVSSLDVINALI